MFVMKVPGKKANKLSFVVSLKKIQERNFMKAEAFVDVPTVAHCPYGGVGSTSPTPSLPPPSVSPHPRSQTWMGLILQGMSHFVLGTLVFAPIVLCF